MPEPKPQQPDAAAPKQSWNGPSLTLKWGPWFTPDPEDESKTVDTATKAVQAGIATKRMAVEKTSRIFGVEDVDTVLEELEDEQATNDERELEKTTAEAETLHSIAASVSGEKPAGIGGASGAKPPKAPRGRGRSAKGSDAPKK